MIKFDQIARATAKLLAIAGAGVALLSSAFAGHYQASLTTGLFGDVSPGYFALWAPAAGSTGGSGGGGGGTATIFGPISTTYTWIPGEDNEPAPESVVVVESCEVYMSAQAFPGSTSASASNGLNPAFCTNTSVSNSIINYGPYVIGSGSSAYSSGTAAKVIQGGAQITVTCSPTGNCSTNNGPISVSASYSVQVYPVRVSVAGTLQVGADTQILPGQKATASLSPGAPGVSVKPGTYSYSALGVKFKDYVVTTTTGTVVGVPASEWTQPSPSWRWRTNGVSIVTGSGTFMYSGVEIGTGSAKKEVAIAEVKSPAFELTPVNTGRVYVDGSTVRLTSKVLGTNGQESPGIWIYWQTQTPAVFATQGTPQNAIVQLVDGKYIAKWSAVDEDIYDTDGEALDRKFPYEGGGWFGETSQFKSTNDFPNMWAGTSHQLYGTLNGLGVDHFSARTFLLYLAPGPDSRPVPLKRQNWTWTGAAKKKPDGSWGWINELTVSKVELNGGIEENPNHPTWIKVKL